MKRKFLVFVFAMSACLCLGLAACGGFGGNGGNGGDEEKGEDGHVHVADNFQVDDEEHWKICTVCGEKFSEGKHALRADDTCEACGFSRVYTEGLQYTLDEETNTYSVTGIGMAADKSKIIIPAYYEGKAVTRIGDEAFRGCSSLESIEIPDSVTSIGSGAFHGTAYYNDQSHWDTSGVLYIGKHFIEAKDTVSGSYTIRTGTKTIADYALKGCSLLESIEIPASVTSIGWDAFDGCSSLNAVYITDLAAWCQIDFEYFSANPLSYAHHLYFDGQEVTELKIPEGVTEIKADAFCYCSSLTSIAIPDSVTSIGSDAFLGCSSSTSIEIPDSVTSIGNEAFRGCSSLERIVIPASVTSIGWYAFYGCGSLESVTIEGGSKLTSIGGFAFRGTAYYNDQSHWDASGVLYIGNHFIEAKDTISGSYTIKTDTKTIADYAFYDCRSLKSIEIPESVTSIGSYAFRYCSSLTSVKLKNGQSPKTAAEINVN